MSKFTDTIMKLKDGLKELLTAENTEAITSLDKELDTLVETHETSEKQLQEVKDKLVDVVKNTSFKGAPEDVTKTEEPLTIDEAIEKLASKYSK